MTVSSMSLGHAATYPEAGGGRSQSVTILTLQRHRGLDHLRDGLQGKPRGIVNRLTFER